LIERELSRSEDLPAAAALVAANIFFPFAASAVYKLTSRERAMWAQRRVESNESAKKQAFTSDLQIAHQALFGRLTGIKAISSWAC
jgi:hypothetical protein